MSKCIFFYSVAFCCSLGWQQSHSLSKRVVDWKLERLASSNTLTWTVYNQQVRGGSNLRRRARVRFLLPSALSGFLSPGNFLNTDFFFFILLVFSRTIRSCNSWTNCFVLRCSNFDLRQSSLSVSPNFVWLHEVFKNIDYMHRQVVT